VGQAELVVLGSAASHMCRDPARHSHSHSSCKRTRPQFHGPRQSIIHFWSVENTRVKSSRCNNCAFPVPLTHITMASTVSQWSTSLKPFKAECSKIAKQYTRLLTLWPKDALRPNLPFTRAIEYRGSPYGVKPIETAPDASSKQATPAKAPSPASPRDPKFEQAQVNALYSLLEDRYSKKYTLSPGVFKPTSAPEHYDRLMAEIERAPKKSWWEAKVDEWKMKIRWS
jgi:cytochrome b pre-mRNA-processing protein 6